MPFSRSLVVAVAVQLLCQLFKVLFYSVKERRMRPDYFVSTGGMPSAHTAFVSTLTVSLGLHHGFSSEFFTIAFVFSAIIVYDLVRVRGAVHAHSRILAMILERFRPREQIDLPHLVGHTVPEILVGLAVGCVAAVAAYFIG
ncbi:MAG: divergent PAP2 family protein [Spirochaetaceae bacterium]|nr:MAG: divergent PAP2 family protein [Spirochaetaceae bacterium]